MKHRVAITGFGLCTPLGCNPDLFWDNLTAGRSGIGRVTLFDASTLPVRIAGEVKELPPDILRARFPESIRLPDRKVWLGLAAAEQALADAALNMSQTEQALLSLGVCLEVFDLQNVAPAAQAPDIGSALAHRIASDASAQPLQVPLDCLTGLLGERYGFNAGRFTNCSACAAGAQAIGEAFRRVREGSSEVALAGATDSTLTPLGLGGFSLLHILSTENDWPDRACRPFDATRQGTVLSEGAAFLVMETLDHATRRGARILAEIVGYGSSLDAFRVTDPEPTGRGAALSMFKAMNDSQLRPEQIDCINAHGTGTPKNDVTETAAIKQVLGDRARHVPITANKSMTGHMIAASGAVEAISSVMTLVRCQIPPTINRERPDPDCDLDYVTEGARPFAGRTVLSNSFGFGGQNASLVFQAIDSSFIPVRTAGYARE